MCEPDPSKIPQEGVNGNAFSATYYAGPLGLTLIDTIQGMCMIKCPPAAGTQSIQHNLIPGDFIISLAGVSLGTPACRGVNGLKNILKSTPRPIEVVFFRFSNSNSGNDREKKIPPPPSKQKINILNGSSQKPPPRRSLSSNLFHLSTKRSNHGRTPPPIDSTAGPRDDMGKDFYYDMAHTPVNVSLQKPAKTPRPKKASHRRIVTAPTVNESSFLEDDTPLPTSMSDAALYVPNLKGVSKPPRKNAPPRKSLPPSKASSASSRSKNTASKPKFKSPPPPVRAGTHSKHDNSNQATLSATNDSRAPKSPKVKMAFRAKPQSKPQPLVAGKLVGSRMAVFEKDKAQTPEKANKISKQASKTEQELKKSSSVASYGGSFIGLKTDSNHSLRKERIGKASEKHVLDHKKPVSVKDRAAIFGGTKKKPGAMSSTHFKSSTTFATEPLMESHRRLATSMPKPGRKKKMNTLSAGLKKIGSLKGVSQKNSVRQGSGENLRGSSLSARRGTPAIVRDSIEKAQEMQLEAKQVKAIYSFDAEANDELSFECGAIITIVSDASKDWWEGTLDGRTGIFPKSYVSSI